MSPNSGAVTEVHLSRLYPPPKPFPYQESHSGLGLHLILLWHRTLRSHRLGLWFRLPPRGNAPAPVPRSTTTPL